MERICRFFENMNEFMYVTDMDTYELLYMNRKTMETFGFHSQEKLIGRKCYEVLHGRTSPCPFCNNDKLSEGNFVEWNFFNTVLKKPLAIKDTMMMDHGRRCRIELAVDNSMQEQQDHAIRSYQNLEAIANEGLKLALRAPTPDKTLEVFLEYLGKSLKGERTYIFEKNENGGDDNTYEWVAQGVTPEKDNLQNLPCEVCANWYRNFSENRSIMIGDLEEIKEQDPLQYANLKRQNIHSLVVVPLYDDEKVIGFYGIDNPPSDNLGYAENMLQIMAHFIISTMRRRELVKQLQNMSYRDQLTQFGNRFGLDEYLTHVNPEESIGVIYCDITGLKCINDTQGHEAGDQMILRACESLKRVFGQYGLFRVGGDEILALCLRITQEELSEKVEALKKDMSKHAVTMAVGASWKNGEKNHKLEFDKLLSKAEKLMYEDKAAYYRTCGIDRRRG